MWHEPPGFVVVVGVAVKPPHNTTHHQNKATQKEWVERVCEQPGWTMCTHRWPWAWWCVVLCGEAKVAAHEALVHKAKGGCVTWAVVGLVGGVGVVCTANNNNKCGWFGGWHHGWLLLWWCGTRHRTHWSSTQPHHVHAMVVVVWMWCLVIDDQPHLGHAQQSSHSWWHCVVVVLFELHQHHTTRGGGICVWCG